MTVRVITDSAATLPPPLADELGVVVVPLRIAVGETAARDGDLDVAELVDRAAEVSTSGPTPGDFLEAIGEEAAGGTVILTVSHEMAAGSHLAAQAAARAAPGPVEVVDTETAAGGQGLVVLAAAQAAAAGAQQDGVVTAATSVAEKVQLVATVPNLDQIARSGHVPGAAAWAARFVGLHPVLDFRRGRVRPLRPAVSEAGATRRILDRLRSTRPEGTARLHVAALHAMAPDPGEALLAAVAAEHQPVTSFLGPFSTAMIVHTGPGLLGLAWWWESGT